MGDPVARLLDLRLRFRRNPEARAYVDRALAVVAKAVADDADLAAIDREIIQLAEDLVLRFGPRRPAPVH
jgi:hypothetical protein